MHASSSEDWNGMARLHRFACACFCTLACMCTCINAIVLLPVRNVRVCFVCLCMCMLCLRACVLFVFCVLRGLWVLGVDAANSRPFSPARASIRITMRFNPSPHHNGEVYRRGDCTGLMAKSQ